MDGKRLFQFVLLLGLSIFYACTIELQAAPNSPNIYVNSKNLELVEPAYVENGTTLVPVRPIAEALGLIVDWGEAQQRIVVRTRSSSGGSRVELYVGDYYVKVNNEDFQLEVCPVIKNGTVFIPLRFVSEALGASVKWEQDDNSIYITNELNNSLLQGKKADTDFSLMNDRLFIKMPKDSVDMALNYGGIMGSLSNSTYETRIMLEDKGQKIVAYAQELNLYSSGDILKDINYYAQNYLKLEDSYTTSQIIKNGNIEYVIVSPNQIQPSEQSLVSFALIKTADETLVSLSIYADEGALTYTQSCIDMAGDIMLSIRSGDRLLDKDPKKLNVFGLTMDIPQGYSLETRMGIDFVVSYINKIVTIGESQASFGIYSGFHPSSFGSELPVIQKVNGTIGGKPVIWDVYRNKADTIDDDTFCETLVEYNNGYLHCFSSPGSQEEWDIILSIFKNIH